MKRSTLSVVAMLVLLAMSCNNITYIPKSKKQRLGATPSVLVFDRIVDFRLEQGGWPSSREDFMSKGIKYYEVMNGFPYTVTSFKIVDSNRMTFYFSGYTKDIERYNNTQVTDLNSYNGSAKFWKENGKFIWKIKMN